MSQDVKQLRVKIFDELSKIVDPEINTTITELELIDEVDISDGNVKVDLHLTSPFCPAVFGFTDRLRPRPGRGRRRGRRGPARAPALHSVRGGDRRDPGVQPDRCRDRRA